MKYLKKIISGAFVSAVFLQIGVLWEIGTIFKTGNGWIPDFIFSWNFMLLGIPFAVIGGCTVGVIILVDVLAEKYGNYEVEKYRKKMKDN